MRSIPVRVNGVLAQRLGTSRLHVSLPEEATVGDLLETLRQTYPAAEDAVEKCVVVVGGKHVSPSKSSSENEEVSLLMPVAGG
jgi:molybdopterin converting factor small subunit